MLGRLRGGKFEAGVGFLMCEKPVRALVRFGYVGASGMNFPILAKKFRKATLFPFTNTQSNWQI